MKPIGTALGGGVSGVQWVVDAYTLVFAFRMGAFSTAASAGLLVNLVFFGLIFALSLFLQRQRGLSPLATGLAFLSVTVLIVVSNLVAGRILPARGTRAVAWAGALLMGAGCLAILGALAARADPLVPALIAGLSLTGFGIGLVVTAITSALLGSVAPAQSGIASGTFTAFRQTGSVLASPCSAPCSPASTRPPAWKSPSPSAPDLSPSSPRSATPPNDPPTRHPASHPAHGKRRFDEQPRLKGKPT